MKVLVLTLALLVILSMGAFAFEGFIEVNYEQEFTGEFEIGNNLNENLLVGINSSITFADWKFGAIGAFAKISIPTDPGLSFRVTVIWENYEEIIGLNLPERFIYSARYEF